MRACAAGQTANSIYNGIQKAGYFKCAAMQLEGIYAHLFRTTTTQEFTGYMQETQIEITALGVTVFYLQALGYLVSTFG